ncbi:hypothetical protein [uncultured Flavobacterium sp.]|uniref:hypothetical protein n=1 Tax=uncultured Flavobacterium sp. TaxID=165435 RepID=UPI0030ED26C2|tara:strand:- start:12779 stop:14059 length:1281 start_codon:yes stop_codon:yes gene_type:complete
MLNSFFKFHPIGQGGFYTGLLDFYGSNHSQFNFVYDCGTLSERSNLDYAIESYKNRLCNKTIDILFISHLDDDHVNGIVDLLNGIRCQNIYLPYLTPFERLLVAIRHNPGDTDVFPNFIRFITSPHDYLLEIEGANIGRINYIKGNSEGEFSIEKKVIDPNETNNEFTDNLDLLPQSEFNAEIASLSQNLKIAFKKANGKLNFGFLWEFYLFHEPGTFAQIVLFRNAIHDIYGFEVDEQLSSAELVTILGNSDNLKELRKRFRAIFRNLNKTSLLVQHKPLSYKYSSINKDQYFTWNVDHYFNPSIKNFRRLINSNANPIDYSWGVTLLTGDIGLDQIENSSYIENHLKHVQVFQVPHHGSNTGWNKRYLEKLNNKGLTSSIINFGYGNTYGHPKSIVLQDLDNDNFDLRFCNQFESFEYRIHLYF